MLLPKELKLTENSTATVENNLMLLSFSSNKDKQEG